MIATRRTEIPNGQFERCWGVGTPIAFAPAGGIDDLELMQIQVAESVDDVVFALALYQRFYAALDILSGSQTRHLIPSRHWECVLGAVARVRVHMLAGTRRPRREPRRRGCAASAGHSDRQC